MRQALHDLLKAGVPSVAQRVLEPHAATKDTVRPYLVVQQGADEPGADWADLSTPFLVWPTVAPNTFQSLDTLKGEVLAALDRRRFDLGGVTHLVVYEGEVGPDVRDGEWAILTRGLRFRVFALGWLGGQTFAPDPVATLRGWTAGVWPEVGVDPATWAPSDATPGVHWRLVRVRPVEQQAAATWYDATLRAHVVAPSPAVRLVYLRHLTEGLATARVVRMSDGGPLFCREIDADSTRDAMREGQVQLLARFAVLVQRPYAVPVGQVVVAGSASGRVYNAALNTTTLTGSEV